MNRKTLLVIIPIITASFLLLSILFSRSNWMVARGSDSLTMVYRLSLQQQISALILIVTLVIAVLFIVRSNWQVHIKSTLCLLCTALICLLTYLCFNAISISGKDKTVSHVWGWWCYNHLVYSDHQYPEGMLHTSSRPPCIVFVNDKGESKKYFSGVFPFQLNVNSINEHPIIINDGSESSNVPDR
jgi:hypothetical protein